MAGKPVSSTIFLASSQEWAQPLFGHLQADVQNGLLEEVAFLGLADGAEVGPEQPDAVLLQHPAFRQSHRRIEAGLSAQRRQQAVGLLPANHLLHHLRRDRLDVGPVGQFRVGHDRRRVAVDQDDLETLLPEHLAGLGSRIVELAGLTDDDRPRADDQYLVDVLTFRHTSSCCANCFGPDAPAAPTTLDGLRVRCGIAHPTRCLWPPVALRSGRAGSLSRRWGLARETRFIAFGGPDATNGPLPPPPHARC